MREGKVGAIVVAAGGSKRMGGIDKIFAPLGGKPLLAHCIDVFEKCPSIDQLVIVVSENKLEEGRRLVREHNWCKVTDVCPGGARRQDSVSEGLKRLPECQWVVIHDGARPCLSVDLIEKGLEEAQDSGAAIAAIPIKDTIKVVSDAFVVETPLRHSLWAIPTPQVFRFDIIDEAYRKAQDEATDDATLVEQLGYRVKVYPGSDSNIKVTTPEDLSLAETILKSGSGARSI